MENPRWCRRSTRRGRTWPGCTTISSAARTTSRPTGRWRTSPAAIPGVRTGARENREFLGRAVRYLAAEAGIRQFLDIGTGLPTTNNVHEVAQAVAPSSRVVYVDNDPLVLAHARALLTPRPKAAPPTSRRTCATRGRSCPTRWSATVLDFTQPVALPPRWLLHFIPDEDSPPRSSRPCSTPCRPAATWSPRTSRTSTTRPARSPPGSAPTGARGVPLHRRDSAEFARLAFTGMELLPPGVVLVSEWRPAGDRAAAAAGRGELLRRGRPKAVIKVTNCGGQPI